MNDGLAHWVAILVTALGVLVAVAALLGPALLKLGITLGQQGQAVKAAHARLDRLEVKLATAVDDLGDRLDNRVKQAMEQAHLWCPFAQRHVKDPHDPGT